jgi:hypothetical protein
MRRRTSASFSRRFKRIGSSAVAPFSNGSIGSIGYDGAKKNGGLPQGRKANKINMVAAAVEIAVGPTAVARLCGVRRQSIYLWIKEWSVERMVDALKLSRASSIPIEKFAGGVVDALKLSRASGNPIEKFAAGMIDAERTKETQ